MLWDHYQSFNTTSIKFEVSNPVPATFKLEDARDLFYEASRTDPALEINDTIGGKLLKSRIAPATYNRETLFTNMAKGKTLIFRDFKTPLRLQPGSGNNPISEILHSISNSGIEHKIRTRAGRGHRWRYYTVEELVEKWQKQKARINVTDLHLRDTPMEQIINTRLLSEFNLLPNAPKCLSWIEMMTLVISSTGGFSDSHSDDCDGSNHCFTGKKLWLAWETQEGINAGLEDLDRQMVSGVPVSKKCAFDMDTFVTLPSAHWFTVEPGQTLFMPGHFTHKVITLESYLGVGSFYLAFPNILRTLSRWLIQKPNWEHLEARGLKDQLYPAIRNTCTRKFRALSRASNKTQEKWGLPFAKDSIEYWKSHASAAEIAAITESGFEDILTLSS
jgi:hypothetical protein